MSKLTAIFFLLTFAWLQYSRQLSFFHCKVTNTFSVDQCDCEKLVSDTAYDSEQNLPLQKTTEQTLTDEYYTPVTTCFYISLIINSNTRHAVQLPWGYTFRYANNLLKPPQA